MDTEKYRIRLKQREEELLERVEKLGSEAREARPGDVEDPIDYVESTEAKAAAFALSTRDYDELRLVREALERIEKGTFGMCIECGREIDPKRLDAVPWTPYCREHAPQ